MLFIHLPQIILKEAFFINDIIFYLILALISSSVGILALCFVGKLIKLKREYTELFIPMIGSVAFLLIFQLGFVSIIEKLFPAINDFLYLTADILISIVISQAIYTFCRKVGRKSTASGRLWIFIGIFALLIILYSITIVVIAVPLSINELGKFLKDTFVKDAYIIPNGFVVLPFIFILLIFNMIFYKITKEISFVIRNKK